MLLKVKGKRLNSINSQIPGIDTYMKENKTMRKIMMG